MQSNLNLGNMNLCEPQFSSKLDEMAAHVEVKYDDPFADIDDPYSSGLMDFSKLNQKNITNSEKKQYKNNDNSDSDFEDFIEPAKM